MGWLIEPDSRLAREELSSRCARLILAALDERLSRFARLMLASLGKLSSARIRSPRHRASSYSYQSSPQKAPLPTQTPQHSISSPLHAHKAVPPGTYLNPMPVVSISPNERRRRQPAGNDKTALDGGCQAGAGRAEGRGEVSWKGGHCVLCMTGREEGVEMKTGGRG